MARKRTIPLDATTEWLSGDPLRAPQGAVPKIKNMFSRPGRLEKRTGWKRETNTAGDPQAFFRLIEDSGTETIGAISSSGNPAVYRNSGGTWTGLGTTYFTATTADHVNHFDACYIASPNSIVSFNGSSLTGNPLQHDIRATTITSFIGRLFIGNVSIPETANILHTVGNPTLPVDFADGADWVTATGMNVATSGTLRYMTFTHGATDTLTLANGVDSGTYGYVTWTQWLRPRSTTAQAYLTMRIINAAGTPQYGALEVVLPVQTGAIGWEAYTLTAAVPASTSIKLQFDAGTTASASSAGVAVDVGDSTWDNHVDGYPGAHLSHGRFTYARVIDIAAATVYTERKRDRIYYSETADPTYWRAINYLDITDVPGEITALRTLGNNLIVHKKRGIWTYRGNSDPDVPLIRQGLIKGVGCVGPQAIHEFDGRHYFVGENEVYEYTPGGAPEPLCGPGRREAMFSPSTLVSRPLLEIDAENKEVFVYTRTGKIDVYNLESRTWSHLTVTGADDAELEVRDLLYAQARNDTKRRMWAIISTGASSGEIVNLNSDQTVDNITGVERNVTAEVVFRPIEAAAPRSEVTVEGVNLRHKVTASQSGSTFTAEHSRNDGVSYGNTNTVVINPLSTGGVEEMSVPIFQTAPRQTVRIKHVGLAGPNYFNVYHGSSADIQIRGPEVDDATPTAVSNTL
jgi:hypothetical protein